MFLTAKVLCHVTGMKCLLDCHKTDSCLRQGPLFDAPKAKGITRRESSFGGPMHHDFMDVASRMYIYIYYIYRIEDFPFSLTEKVNQIRREPG